jgi:hypothetical protein
MTKPRPGSAPPIRAGSFPDRARRSCPQEAQSRKRWGSRGPPRRSGLPIPVATWPQVCNLRGPAARGCPCPSPSGRRFATCGAPPLGAAHTRRHVAAGLQPAVPRRSGLPMPVATWPQVCNLRCPAARGCPCPSPDARCGHPALRSLGVPSASPSWLAEETNAGSRARAAPSSSSGGLTGSRASSRPLAKFTCDPPQRIASGFFFSSSVPRVTPTRLVALSAVQTSRPVVTPARRSRYAAITFPMAT